MVWVLGNHDAARVLPSKDYHRYSKYIGSQALGWTDPRSEDDQFVQVHKLFAPGSLMGVYMSIHTVFSLTVGDFVFMHGSIDMDLATSLRAIVPKEYGVLEYVNYVVRRYMMGTKPDDGVMRILDLAKKCLHRRSFIVGSTKNPKATVKSSTMCNIEIRGVFSLLGMDWNKGGFVVGHSIQTSGIPLYCSGRVWRLDMGMSSAFKPTKKRPSIIGGIKIYQSIDLMPIILTVMNYETRMPGKDQFVLHIRNQYPNVFTDRSTVVKAGWSRTMMTAEAIKDIEMRDLNRRLAEREKNDA